MEINNNIKILKVVNSFRNYTIGKIIEEMEELDLSCEKQKELWVFLKYVNELSEIELLEILLASFVELGEWQSDGYYTIKEHYKHLNAEAELPF